MVFQLALPSLTVIPDTLIGLDKRYGILSQTAPIHVGVDDDRLIFDVEGQKRLWQVDWDHGMLNDPITLQIPQYSWIQATSDQSTPFLLLGSSGDLPLFRCLFCQSRILKFRSRWIHICSH